MKQLASIVVWLSVITALQIQAVTFYNDRKADGKNNKEIVVSVYFVPNEQYIKELEREFENDQTLLGNVSKSKAALTKEELDKAIANAMAYARLDNPTQEEIEKDRVNQEKIKNAAHAQEEISDAREEVGKSRTKLFWVRIAAIEPLKKKISSGQSADIVPGSSDNDDPYSILPKLFSQNTYLKFKIEDAGRDNKAEDRFIFADAPKGGALLGHTFYLGSAAKKHPAYRVKGSSFTRPTSFDVVPDGGETPIDKKR